MRGLLAIYNPVLDWALTHRKTVLGGAAGSRCWRGCSGLLVCLGVAGSRIRADRCEEGSLLFMPVLLPQTSLTEVNRIMAWQDDVIRQTPEVAHGRRQARPRRHRDRPRAGRDDRDHHHAQAAVRMAARHDEGIAHRRAHRKLIHVPGYVPGFLQPIENRILMMSTGIRAQVGVKIFGDDLRGVSSKGASKPSASMRDIPGASGRRAVARAGQTVPGNPPDRAAMARYGLRAAGTLRRGRGRARRDERDDDHRRPRALCRSRCGWQRGERDDIERLARSRFHAGRHRRSRSARSPTIARVTGPSEIASENGRLRVFVQANVATGAISAASSTECASGSRRT